MPSLFRHEALEARRYTAFGQVVVRPPLAFGAWCALAVALSAAVLALLVGGEYTRRARVHGITVPAAGVLRITSPQPGIVTERRVEEGDRVRAGQVLFVVSTDRIADAGAPARGAQAAIVEQLQRRRSSLVEELGRRAQLLEQQALAAAQRLQVLEQEAAQLRRELATQSSRETSASEHAERFDALARQGFVSPLAVRQRRDELLDQTARRQALERSLLAVRREQAAAAADLRQFPLRAEAQRAELQRELSALQQDIVVAEASRRAVVTAPHDGTVTAIVAERGQAVGAQTLATLLPAGAPLEAHLFAPSRAIGFVESGQPVRVRFAAYPYQKFGQLQGVVAQVSRAALAPAELPPQLGMPPTTEPLYRITVQLAAAEVHAYGRPQPLTAGMQLEADVMQDRRRLIEWVFEPLLGLRGRI